MTNETMTSEIIMATSASESAPSQMTSQATTLGISGDTTPLMTSQTSASSISGDTNQSTTTADEVSSSMSPPVNPMSPNELEGSKAIGISVAGGFLGGIIVVLLLLLLCCVPMCFKVRRKKKKEYYVTSSKNCECVCGELACMIVGGQVYCTSFVP